MCATSEATSYRLWMDEDLNSERADSAELCEHVTVSSSKPEKADLSLAGQRAVSCSSVLRRCVRATTRLVRVIQI